MTCLAKISTFFVISLIAVMCFTTAFAQSPLNVIEVRPADGAVDVAADQSSTVAFSFTLNPATITNASVFLTDPLGNLVAADLGTSGGNTAKIDLIDFLAPGTMYTIHITPALQDIAGNSLAAEFTSTFTTAVPDTERVETLSPAILWMGLKNSDDQGTSFDLKTEVYINDTLISDGITRCITGVTRNPSKAKEIEVPFGTITDNGFEVGDLLSLKVLTRIGTNPNDSKCPGHNNAVGLRLYYDAASRPSGFGAQIAPNPLTDLFLHSNGTKFLNGVPPTATTAKFQE